MQTTKSHFYRMRFVRVAHLRNMQANHFMTPLAPSKVHAKRLMENIPLLPSFLCLQSRLILWSRLGGCRWLWKWIMRYDLKCTPLTPSPFNTNHNKFTIRSGITCYVWRPQAQAWSLCQRVWLHSRILKFSSCPLKQSRVDNHTSGSHQLGLDPAICIYIALSIILDP